MYSADTCRIDPALLAAPPELAVLTMDLPDSDGESIESVRPTLVPIAYISLGIATSSMGRKVCLA
jgi:hypothetical protein